MFFFIFDEPRQIDQFRVESLSQFIDLLDDNGELYRAFCDEFHFRESDELFVEGKDYKYYIAESESKLKRSFAQEIVHRRNEKKGLASRFNVFYRGISDITYQPIPSVYRGGYLTYEDRFINELRVTNPDFVQGRTYIDELSALQHYGCPTRLLDLTRNPLVALYFACADILENRDPKKMTDGMVQLFLAEEDGILHLNSDKVLILTAMTHLTEKNKKDLFDICDNEIKSKGRTRAKLDSSLLRRIAVKKLYQEILRVANFDKDILCADLLQSFYVQPALNNLRIRAQSGLFLINGLCGNSRECANRNENKIFAKVTIPYSAKKGILEELDRVAINNKTLFPEIQDAITYLKSKFH